VRPGYTGSSEWWDASVLARLGATRGGSSGILG
jgi:hypothetical protein